VELRVAANVRTARSVRLASPDPRPLDVGKLAYWLHIAQASNTTAASQMKVANSAAVRRKLAPGCRGCERLEGEFGHLLAVRRVVVDDFDLVELVVESE